MTMSALNKAQADDGAWHRQPFVWLLIAIPLSAVVVGLTMLGLAIATYDGLVVDDYYRRGKEINRVLARDQYAVESGLHAVIDIADNDSQRLTLGLQHKDGVRLPEEVELRFLHATRAGEDRVLRVLINASGEARAPLPRLIAGRWIVQLGTEQWRLVGSLQVPGPDYVELVPVVAGSRDQ